MFVAMFNFKKPFVLLALILPLFLFPVFIAANGAPAFPGGGSGTEGDPYVITDIDELQWIKNDLSAHYILGNDIDASDTETWNEDPENLGTYFGFEPIGDNMMPFTGTLDGRGYVIDGLCINRLGSQYNGLFGAVGENATIENLGIVQSVIAGGKFTGGLAGRNDGIITRSYFEGGISSSGVGGGWYVGGLVGNNYGTIGLSYSAGTVVITDIEGSDSEEVGGLVGTNSGGGIVSNSYSSSSVVGRLYVGGLVGDHYGEIIGSYATGLINGDVYIGGLIGANEGGSVYDSYATGDVNGNDFVGGLAGINWGGVISNSYSLGSVSGSTFIGGLIGNDGSAWGQVGTTQNSFWNTETSGQATSAGGTGKTSMEMKTLATFTDTSTEGLDNSWDFAFNPNDDEGDEDLWNLKLGVNDDYPFLVAFFDAPGVSDFGPENLTDGSATDSANPVLTFSITNPYEGQDVRYRIQIATSGDFSSLVVDYTSGWQMSGGSFAVGQAVGGAGYYAVGEPGQTLPEGDNPDYYWRVRAYNIYGTASDWVMANDGAVAFYYEEGGDVGGVDCSLLDFVTGSGTEGDPYVITDVDELQLIASCLSAHYILGNDIDASETEEWNDGAGWVTIGGWDDPFLGSLDGRGHVISGLYINRPEESNLGLFGELGEGGEIKNLGLDNINFLGNVQVAGLLGRSNLGTIDSVYVTGSIATTEEGMVSVGLVAGQNFNLISNSYFDGIVESGYLACGLVMMNDGTITNSYATGQINGAFDSGWGLVCMDEESSAVTNSFWDTETSGVIGSGGGTGKTTSEMKTLATFTDWNIAPIGSYVDETWYIDEGNDYPRLGWQHSSPGEPEPEPDPDPQPQPTRRRITGSVASPRVTPTPSTPPTITQLTALLTQLQAQLNALLASRDLISSSPTPVFTRNLTLGDTGPDVRALQVFLNTNGFVLTTTGPGSPGNETERFGPLTQASLVRFQTAHNITPALGYFGPVTRAKVLEMMGR